MEREKHCWAQVDLEEGRLLLPDRTVPLAPELAAWLEELRRVRNGTSERIALSDRDQRPLAAQSISRLARTALDAVGLTAVRLDLARTLLQETDADIELVAQRAGRGAQRRAGPSLLRLSSQGGGGVCRRGRGPA